MDWPDSPDAAPLGDGRHAVAVDRPESVAHLREAVARRASEGLAIYPQGGKTALDYGGVPRRPGVALDTTALDAVIDYPAADMTITVNAGITLAKLQEVLATEGQFLPLDAPDPDRATLGGIYATNTSGPRRFGWGRPRDMIIGVSFVTADGKEIKGGGRVVKNVAGYDFPKLLTGSMGTLGVITQMTLKVRPRPEATALVVVPFDSGKALQAALDRLNTSVTRPAAIEVLNEPGSRLLDSDGGAALGSSKWTLIVGFEDNASSVAWQVERLPEELGRPSADCGIRHGEDAQALWAALCGFASIEDNNSCLSHTTSLPRSKAFGFGKGLNLSWHAVNVHAGSGVVTAHSPDGLSIENLAPLFPGFREEATRLTGNLILSRCPTEWKERLNVWGDRRGDWAIMEKIKAALDPGGVMNPGRFVGTI